MDTERSADEPTLAELGRPGPFFTLRHGQPPPEAVPVASLREDGVDALHGRLRAVGRQLGTGGEPRVAASLVYQGLASRLWSIALSGAVLAGALPDLSGGRLWWSPAHSTPEELWLPGPVRWRPGSAEPEAVWSAVWEGHLLPLAGAVRAVTPVAARLLRGNAASALAGAGRELQRWAGIQRPAAAARAGSVTGALLARPELAAEGALESGGAVGGAVPFSYRRRSCCLYYRVPGGGFCGDCVFG